MVLGCGLSCPAAQLQLLQLLAYLTAGIVHSDNALYCTPDIPVRSASVHTTTSQMARTKLCSPSLVTLELEHCHSPLFCVGICSTQWRPWHPENTTEHILL